MSKQPTVQKGSQAKLDNFVFYGTVSVTGAAVMMVELLGTRIIGPYYGVSLVVWSSLLSVSLLALAFGYYLGGFFAANRGQWRLPHAVFTASVFIAAIPVLSQPVQLMFNGLGLRGGALASAFVLFTPALLMLGMAGPLVIQMATARVERVGATAGNVYAISTIGSVLGTLVLGFYLLPLFGTHAILWALALVLLLLALLLVIYERHRMKLATRLWPWLIAGLLVVIGVGAQAANASAKFYENYNVLFEQETHYGWVRVVDQPEKDLRWLMSDASTIGVEHLPTGQGLLGYQSIVRTLPWFKLESEKALLIGLGAGHLVADLAKFGIATDAIEIDPAVAKSAVDFFNFRPTGKVIVGDARYQVQRLENQKYDLIIHDCFTGGAEPFHLLSEEMIQLLKSRLTPNGVLAVNFVGFTDPTRLKPVQSIAATLDAVFAHRKNYVPRLGEDFSDYVFIVSDAPLNPGLHPSSKGTAQWLAQREVNIPAGDAPVITDDYNPLEFLQIAKAEYYRKLLIDRVGESVLFR